MFGTHSSRRPSGSETAPVIFVHGSLSSRHMWAPYAAALGSRPSIAIDLAGYGDEPAWPGGLPYRLSDAAAPIRRVVPDSGDPVDIVAHSFGGAVALRYALENPARVSSLTLIEPSWFGVLGDRGPRARPALRRITTIRHGFATAQGDPHRLSAMERFVDYRNGPRTWTRLSVARKASLAVKSEQVRRDFEAIFAERLRLAAFRRLDVPTLVATGTTSPAAALLAAEALVRAVRSASWVTVAGAGHMLPSTHVADLAAILRARLEMNAASMPWAA
jgi:pimeloyl-ACP methyl ester carboxylesterase